MTSPPENWREGLEWAEKLPWWIAALSLHVIGAMLMLFGWDGYLTILILPDLSILTYHLIQQLKIT